MIVPATETRLRYLRSAIAAAFVVGILFSHKLWFGAGRSFPRTPIISSLPDTFSLLEFFLSPLLLILLTFIAFRKNPMRLIVIALVLIAVLVFLDQTRLQPWVYQYSLLLGIIAFQSNSASTTLAACQLAVAAQYFWSGIQKLNWSFAHKILPDIVAVTGISLPQSVLRLLPPLAIVVALSEALLGLALLFRRTRSAAVIVAIMMHVVLLLLMITARQNSVIWPWNVAMIVIVGVLFWRADVHPRSLSRATYAVRALLAICCLAPALSFAGWWDLYLSSALYSGNTPNAAIRINEEVRQRLSPKTQQLVFFSKAGEPILPVYEWSISDLNIPQYPEVRVYKQLGWSICRLAAGHKDIELIIQERPSIIDGTARVTRWSCLDLGTH